MFKDQLGLLVTLRFYCYAMGFPFDLLACSLSLSSSLTLSAFLSFQFLLIVWLIWNNLFYQSENVNDPEMSFDSSHPPRNVKSKAFVVHRKMHDFRALKIRQMVHDARKQACAPMTTDMLIDFRCEIHKMYRVIGSTSFRLAIKHCHYRGESHQCLKHQCMTHNVCIQHIYRTE